MKIPKQLKVGGHTIKVEIKDMGELDGRFDGEKNIIYIDKDISTSRQEATLFHEVFHAMNAVWGETNIAHMFLDSLAEQLYQVLSDNNLI